MGRGREDRAHQTAVRARIVICDSPLLLQMFGGHPMRSMTSDWPADAQLRGAEWDMTRGVFRLLIESATFEDAPTGSVFPDWNPTFTEHLMAPEVVELMARFRVDEGY